LHLLRRHFNDLATPDNNIADDTFTGTCCTSEIALCDSLALAAAKFGTQPFRMAVPGIECPIEFVHAIIKMHHYR
jgi:hypothetical protein